MKTDFFFKYDSSSDTEFCEQVSRTCRLCMMYVIVNVTSLFFKKKIKPIWNRNWYSEKSICSLTFQRVKLNDIISLIFKNTKNTKN